MSCFGEQSECEPDEHSQEAEADPEASQRGHVLHVTLRPREVTHRPHVTRGRPIFIRYLFFVSTYFYRSPDSRAVHQTLGVTLTTDADRAGVSLEKDQRQWK